MKTCKRCGLLNELKDFKPRITGDGLGNVCRTCQNAGRRKLTNGRRNKVVQEKKVKKTKPVLMPAENLLALQGIMPDLKQYTLWLSKRMNLTGYDLQPDDMLQESLIKMLNAPNHPPVSDLKYWGMRIIKNTTLEIIRLLTPTVELEEWHMRTPIYTVDEHALEKHMYKALSLIKPAYQHVIKLRLEGLSYEEIVACTHHTLGGIKSTLNTAKKALKKAMNNLPYEDGY